MSRLPCCKPVQQMEITSGYIVPTSEKSGILLNHEANVFAKDRKGLKPLSIVQHQKE